MTYRDSIIVKNNGMTQINVVEVGEGVVAYRVPEDAEKAVYLVDIFGGCTVTIKAADHVFGGKDLVVHTEDGYGIVYVDLNTYIQRSGEHKGCVLIESDDDTAMCELTVLE